MSQRVLVLFFIVASSCGTLPTLPDASLEDAGVEPLDGGDDAGLDETDAGADAGSADASVTDAGTRDAGVDGGVVVLVPVSSERELRGVWVSTVSNLDVPQLADGDAGVAALRALVERSKAAGLNALFFQIRPESDAWYRSTLEPFSRFLAGAQGRDPGWDPLATLVDVAHAQGLEVHAWVNPYRGLASANATTAQNHVTRTLSAHAISYDGKVTMNPASLEVRAHVLAVVRDVLTRYDVDGLHFDDYFYPYPDGSSSPFPDEANFQSFRADGGTLTKSDWRRENVNALIREVMQVVSADFSHVRFGVSPFGIYRPGQPAGVVGLDAYEVLSCDAVKWMNEGWVDYLAPQLYWPTTSTGQPFVPLLNWWGNGARQGRHVFPGHGLYRLGNAGWDAAEVRAQINATRSTVQRDKGVGGGIHFREAMIRQNVSGVADLFRNELYVTKALLPPLPRSSALITPSPPTVVADSTGISVSTGLSPARFVVLYRWTGSRYVLEDVKGAPSARFVVPAGTYAVSAVGRGGAESQAAVSVRP